MISLSERQTDLLNIIRTAALAGERCPTNREVGMAFGVCLRGGAVPAWFKKLKDAGVIEVETKHHQRQVRIVDEDLLTAAIIPPKRKKPKAFKPKGRMAPVPTTGITIFPDHVSLADLRPRECHMIYNDDMCHPECCGRPALPGEPYCGTHYLETHKFKEADNDV